MVEKAAEEIARRKTKSVLKKGSWHHNFIGVRGGDVFILHRPPLEYGTVGEKMVLD
jgi:hypothetical protein